MAAPAPHLFLLPSLGIGHLIPFTELAKRLAARRFLVSLFVSSGHGLSIARNKIADAANIRIVELHLSHQINIEASDSKSYASDQIPPQMLLNHTLLQDAFQKLLMPEQNENGFRLMYPPPLCIVTDFLLCWTVTMAAKLGIPRVNVECSPAYSQNLIEVLWGKLPRNLERSSSGRYIVPHQAKRTLLSRSQMPPDLPDADETHWTHKMNEEYYRLSKQSWMNITNSFYELEGDHVDEFQKRYAGPVRPIGPLLPESFISGQYLTTPTARLASAELDWLDHRSPRSVVYVSFGSQSCISSSQIMELALGLEASGKPFLWVHRLPVSDENNPALDGFYRRTEQQGRIVSGWTDQLAVLSHPSVGAFITHCGWNSSLEAISIGVPLICWPLFGEQHFNARLIVDEAKVGIEVVPRDEDQMVTRNEIEKSVRILMDDDHNGDERVKSLKENCNRLKELARKAVSEDGSSSKNFNMLVDDILSLQNKKENIVSNSM
jgi:UDP-glucosyl transferase 73C